MSGATATAAVGAGYQPPLATTTAAAKATGTSLSFANVASQTYTGSVTTSAQIVDSTGGVDSSSLLEYFTRPYLDAHTLSIPTWRYAYILWFIIIGTLILWSTVYHLSGTGTGGSAIGAWFRKISIRRITWTRSVGGSSGSGGRSKVGIDPSAVEEGTGASRTRKKVVWASPTLAQVVAVLVLIGAALCVSFIGDDYIAPTTCVFGGECGYQAYYGSSGPPKSTYRVKRAFPALRFSSFASDFSASLAAPPTPAGVTFPVEHAKRGVNNPNGWAPFNDPLLASSNANIPFNTWSASARLGLISYAMLPLVITLALKQWPFNIWASPFLTNYHFDKTAILHRWSGRVVWVFSTGHAVGWFVQLAHDKDPFGRPVLVPIWSWYRFCAGAVAWGLLTILTAFSFRPIRDRYYELFYWSHVGLVILFLAACIVHHAPLLWWPLIALVWWGAERLVRFAVFLWVNGLFEGIFFREPSSARSSRQSFAKLGGQEKGDGFSEVKLGNQGGEYPPHPYDESREPLQAPVMNRSGSYPPASPTLPPFGSPAAPSYQSSPLYASTSSPRPLPPPGFASAQLLPGRTIRLTLHVPHSIRWASGQHLLLYAPQVRFFESHPYTIASVDERAKGVAPVGGNVAKKGSEIVLLIRAQGGFSKALWDHVVRHRRASVGAVGVNLRAMVSWPMGSAGRASWGAYESLLIVCGGTGISFGVSVLENACRRMVRKEQDGKWKTRRVRFVWIMREFAHLSWVASTLRRCIEMCDASQLQVDLFVTHDAPKRPSRPRQRTESEAAAASTDDLAPPTAPFARGARAASPAGRESIFSEMSDWSDGETSPTSPRRQTEDDAHGEEGHEVDSVTDFVLFEGEDEYRTAGEAEVSAKLKKEGKLRRALSRRGQGRSLRRPERDVPPPSRRPDPFTNNSTASFEPLPLESSSASPTPPQLYEPRSASIGDLGAARAYSSVSLDYGHEDARSDAGTLVGGSTRHLIKQPSGGLSSNRNSLVDMASYGGISGFGGQAPAAKVASEDPDESFFLDVTAAEQEDLEAVTELAKSGYPRLKEILNDEVERSAGKTVVACCGPSGLNTVVRNLVAKKIDLKRVAKGDPRAQVSLIVEDFSF
ncbi:hypothetical protein JCM11641_002845 [Rhodosporidiobolus odoratus]